MVEEPLAIDAATRSRFKRMVQDTGFSRTRGINEPREEEEKRRMRLKRRTIWHKVETLEKKVLDCATRRWLSDPNVSIARKTNHCDTTEADLEKMGEPKGLYRLSNSSVHTLLA